MAGNDTESKRPIRLFYSYSHEDEELCRRLEKHLAHMRWSGLIAEWHDRNIGAGDDWENAIDENLATADVILLLLSASFIASPYCWSKEMTKALERVERGEARVIPVILRPCQWIQTPLKVLQAVPKGAKPVTTWANEDEAFDDVAARIEAVVEELRNAASSAARPPDRYDRSGAAAGSRVETCATCLGSGRLRSQHGFFIVERTCRSCDGTGQVVRYIGVDWRELPDLAVFKDDDLPWLPEMVVIPAGTFLMGSPPGEEGRWDDEGPQHRVTIGKRFAIGRYAVTFAAYDHFCEVTKRVKPSDEGWGRGRRPVINVSWEDAKAYGEWMSVETGQLYRLPSEAEWEYACRAGTTTPFSFGATITPVQANYDGNSGYGGGPKGVDREQTVSVGSLPASPWRLHEMHGNVWEWCLDGKRTYTGKAVTDPLGPIDPGVDRGLRGGSWNYAAHHMRSACRFASDSDDRCCNFGFRCAQVQEP